MVLARTNEITFCQHAYYGLRHHHHMFGQFIRCDFPLWKMISFGLGNWIASVSPYSSEVDQIRAISKSDE